MAAYLDLRDLFNDSELRNRTQVAVAVSAHALATTGAPTDDDLAWVALALGNTGGEAEKALKFVLAENKSASVGAIQGADDATLQSAVDLVVPTLVTAYKAERAAQGGGV